MINWQLVLYMAVALAYIGYPLYLLMGPAHAQRVRVLALGLVAYGLAGVFWPGGADDIVLLLAGASVAIGLGLLFQANPERWPWLLAMAYSLTVLGSSSVTDPVWTFIAALVFVVGFERALLNKGQAAPAHE